MSILRDSDFSGKTYIGVVEDNKDPKKLGRVRARVLDVFDEIPTEDLPWATPYKDINGNTFNLPDVGKVLVIIFDEGDIYKPEFIYSEHYNINLEKKLSGLSDGDYLSMKSLIYDHITQIYVNESEGLKLDHKFNVINITKDAINLNLKDNFANVHIGTEDASQQAILGNHFLNWFDKFVDNLLGSQGGPYLGNLGVPVIPNPAMIQCLLEYKAKKDPKFLSHRVHLVDNGYVNKLNRIAEGQKGDKWKSTKEENELTYKEPVDYKSKSGVGTESPNENTPSDNITPSSSNAAGDNQEPTKQTDTTPNTDITPDTHPDIVLIIKTMNKKGYSVYERPYEMNIVGIRNQYVGEKYSNEFKDHIYLFYKDDSGGWQQHKWPISTLPGLYKKKSENLKMKAWASTNRPKGLGILVPGQYKYCYQVGDYHGARGMRTVANAVQKAYRDKHFDDDRIFFDNVGNLDTGNHAMFIHRGFPGGVLVNNWSEGCQVFKQEAHLNKFFDICNEHTNRKYGNFSYTLMQGRDLDETEQEMKLENGG